MIVGVQYIIDHIYIYIHIIDTDVHNISAILSSCSQLFWILFISRLGRLRPGGAMGPGLFFIMPCIDTYNKVDLRTVSFDVPPQEVSLPSTKPDVLINYFLYLFY